MRRASCAWVRQGNSVLLVWNQRFQGWCLPGGKAEPGETPAMTMRRELLEETEVKAIQWRKEPIYVAPGNIDLDMEVSVFEVTQWRGKKASRFDTWTTEPGCPVWWTDTEKLVSEKNPFAAFYTKMFCTAFYTKSMQRIEGGR